MRVKSHNLRIRAERYLKTLGFKFHTKFGYIEFQPDLSKDKYRDLREFLSSNNLTIRYYDGCFCPYLTDKEQ
jgi:hypothetical protein